MKTYKTFLKESADYLWTDYKNQYGDQQSTTEMLLADLAEFLHFYRRVKVPASWGINVTGTRPVMSEYAAEDMDTYSTRDLKKLGNKLKKFLTK